MADNSSFIENGMQHAQRAIKADREACSSNDPDQYNEAYRGKFSFFGGEPVPWARESGSLFVERGFCSWLFCVGVFGWNSWGGVFGVCTASYVLRPRIVAWVLYVLLTFFYSLSCWCVVSRCGLLPDWFGLPLFLADVS